MRLSKFRRAQFFPSHRRGERGVTMALVAGAIVTIMAMAALSIDVVTLYLANAETQRAADAAALAGARVLSASGMTGDPQNATDSWQPACLLAKQIAKTVATRNSVAGALLTSAQVDVNFPNNSDSTSCTGNDPGFGVNPLVQVKVTRPNLPTFFARIWGRKGSSISATATAEAFNSSNSPNFSASGNMIPVHPRCVKPWIVPNQDPTNSSSTFVDVSTGSITNQGIFQRGGAGVIGKSIFTLRSDCGVGAGCVPSPNPPTGAGNTLYYVPAWVQSPAVGFPSCAAGDDYQMAVAGCDQSTVYACGTLNGANVDLTINPGNSGGDTDTAGQCLIHQPDQDVLNVGTFPYRILAGEANPLVTPGGVPSGSAITASNSIVTVPIYDSSSGTPLVGTTPPVTIVGFLQVFIDSINPNGDPRVRVLNVSGCSNTAPAGGVTGTSPVPVRLITYP